MSDAPYWVSPREANLLITGRCNLRCRHCSVLSHGPLKEDLPLSDWERILDELARNKLIKLTLTGGEPLVREDFPEFLDAVAERPFRFSVNTNGTLITPGVIESLVKHRGRLNDVMVSLDGPDAETVDSQRGEGVFEKLILGVKKLRTAGLPFGFYCTVTSLNVDRLVETADLAMRTGAGWIKFNLFLRASDTLETKLLPDRAKVLEQTVRLLEHPMQRQNGIGGVLMDTYRTRMKCIQDTLPVSHGRSFSCPGGTMKTAVFPNGDVGPCDHVPDLVFGNLLSKGLEEILTGEGNTRFQEMLRKPRRTNGPCVDCGFLSLCTGGCPVETLAGVSSEGIDRISCLRCLMENTWSLN